jgi:monothiol glutaredoxin
VYSVCSVVETLKMSNALLSIPRRPLRISSAGAPAYSASGSWGPLASLLHKPDRLLAINRTTNLLPTLLTLAIDAPRGTGYHHAPVGERRKPVSPYFYEVNMDTQERIRKQVTGNKVVLYMKGTPDAPQCGFSATAVQILEACGAEDVATVNVLADAEIRQGIKEFASWPTIPQLYINGEFVGGADIMREMYENGELEKVLKG